MATNAAFLSAIQGLSISGVTRHYDEPPASIHTADLPAAFPLLPGGGLGEKQVTCFNQNKTRSIDFIIAIEPVGQGTQAANYARLAALMDALESVVDDLEKSQGGSLATFIEYTIESAIVTIGGTDFWAIRAAITARDI